MDAAATKNATSSTVTAKEATNVVKDVVAEASTPSKRITNNITS
jgi:hypothetical protein